MRDARSGQAPWSPRRHRPDWEGAAMRLGGRALHTKLGGLCRRQGGTVAAAAQRSHFCSKSEGKARGDQRGRARWEAAVAPGAIAIPRGVREKKSTVKKQCGCDMSSAIQTDRSAKSKLQHGGVGEEGNMLLVTGVGAGATPDHNSDRQPGSWWRRANHLKRSMWGLSSGKAPGGNGELLAGFQEHFTHGPTSKLRPGCESNETTAAAETGVSLIMDWRQACMYPIPKGVIHQSIAHAIKAYLYAAQHRLDDRGPAGRAQQEEGVVHRFRWSEGPHGGVGGTVEITCYLCAVDEKGGLTANKMMAGFEGAGCERGRVPRPAIPCRRRGFLHS
ncbi:hypothetical protein M011DRAFT_75107 [Sporormia fimetaria CBS 119925]|uniref:Uncharacterized protein n=1 Tax=Sporormia fimetaria CBS 119925 TaxID=1340428 RepID=A0A6A6V984_9PLEO|nr:hypothetical protein M011DRAFT_75107 [Sporormia fimetaria CBS 119925]